MARSAKLTLSAASQNQRIIMYRPAYKEHAPLPTQEEKQVALRYILEAWEEAVYDGLDPDCIATAAIFAALSDMIASYGEEPVAVMCERLPERIRAGEFTVMKTKQ
jgi:predicted YcjX-like family ATPase